MKTNAIRKHQFFQDGTTELFVVEKFEVESVQGGRGGYCHVTLEPFAVIVHHAGFTHAVDMQGSVVPVDQLPEAV